MRVCKRVCGCLIVFDNNTRIPNIRCHHNILNLNTLQETQPDVRWKLLLIQNALDLNTYLGHKTETVGRKENSFKNESMVFQHSWSKCSKLFQNANKVLDPLWRHGKSDLSFSCNLWFYENYLEIKQFPNVLLETL